MTRHDTNSSVAITFKMIEDRSGISAVNSLLALLRYKCRLCFQRSCTGLLPAKAPHSKQFIGKDTKIFFRK